MLTPRVRYGRGAGKVSTFEGQGALASLEALGLNHKDDLQQKPPVAEVRVVKTGSTSARSYKVATG